MQVGSIHKEGIVVYVGDTLCLYRSIRTAENVCACEGRIVVAEENVVMYVGIYGGHELIAIAHVEHEAVNGHRAVYLVAQHVVELAQRDKALAAVVPLCDWSGSILVMYFSGLRCEKSTL